MAISIQPVDGLINRLLQQNGKPSSVTQPSAPAQAAKQDQMNISSSAHSLQTPSTESQIQSKQAHQQPSHQSEERTLESHLLNLYRTNDRFGG